MKLAVLATQIALSPKITFPLTFTTSKLLTKTWTEYMLYERMKFSFKKVHKYQSNYNSRYQITDYLSIFRQLQRIKVCIRIMMGKHNHFCKSPLFALFLVLIQSDINKGKHVTFLADSPGPTGLLLFSQPMDQIHIKYLFYSL